MSKMADLDLEIRELLEDGVSPSVISKELKVPVTWVYVTMKELELETLSEKGNTEVFSPFVTMNS
jgi:hypothetical protein